MVSKDNDIRQFLYDHGILDCIFKPMIIKELLFRVRSAIHSVWCNCIYTPEKNTTHQPFYALMYPDYLPQTTSNLIEKACEYMQLHISDKLYLNDIAISIGTNRSKLASAFKQELGISVFKWLRETRMQQAKILLTTTHLSVQQIGFEVGFENAACFSNTYKNRFNLSPRQQRKK